MPFRNPSITLGACLLWAGCGAGPPPLEIDELDVWVDPNLSEDLQDLELTITPVGADALNPNGDGSGRLELRAFAAKAQRYTFTVGNGDPIPSTGGEIEVTVEREGTRTYTVQVYAFTEEGGSSTLSESVDVYRTDTLFPRLVWADEFEGSGRPDSEKWVHQTRPPLNGGWFNGEQQHYTDRAENSFVSDGTLKIVAKAERHTTEGSQRPFTSARMNSTSPFTYGRVEVRAKLPAEGGTWPAIWTLGANINELGNPFGTEYGNVGWPACGEIDIMEQRGWDKDTTLAYFHWGNTRTGDYEYEGSEIRKPQSTQDWQVYSLEWTEDRLQVFVDGDLVHTLANTDERPYHNPHYLLLNIAMGGNLGGDIPSNFSQATLEIDYVRVYQ